MTSHVEQALMQGEQVLYQGRVSRWALFWPDVPLGVLLTPVIIGRFLLGAALIKRYATEVVGTTHRVIVRRGLIQRDTVELNTRQIETAQVMRGLLGRMFDFRTLAVAGGGHPRAAVDGIAEPSAFSRACLEARQAVLGNRAPLQVQAGQ